MNLENLWQPERTLALVVGITAWPAAADLPPSLGVRRDIDLVDQLKSAGVPAGNIVFLKDAAATHAGMRTALQSLAARSGPDSTLIFCFLGHGGRGLLYCYDYDDQRPRETVFLMEEIFPILEKSWAGNRLILIGDFCGSGSLDAVLRQFEEQRPAVRVAVLASAMPTSESTENWTYTEGIIRVLAGDPVADHDRDGRITLADARRFLHDQMKYRENQLACLVLTANFEKDFVMRAVSGGAAPADLLEIRGAARARLNVGQRYEVIWQGKWYPATITDAIEDYFYFVRYEEGTGEHDEWITPDRARQAGAIRRRQSLRQSQYERQLTA
jgi:hypothetical protein